MDSFAVPDGVTGIRGSTHADPPTAGASLVIRRARVEDLGAVAALFGPALEPYRGRGAEWILDAYLADLLDVRSRFDAGETYVAVRDGQVVGSIAFYPDVALEGWSTFPTAWAGFRALAVDPAVRRGGVGRVLVETCLTRAREVGATVLGIHTISLLVDAVNLYERVGFVRCPEFDMLAAEVFPAEGADDMRALAFRFDLP